MVVGEVVVLEVVLPILLVPLEIIIKDLVAVVPTMVVVVDHGQVELEMVLVEIQEDLDIGVVVMLTTPAVEVEQVVREEVLDLLELLEMVEMELEYLQHSIIQCLPQVQLVVV
jgi:hypothetical protein